MLLVTGASGFVGQHLLAQLGNHSPANTKYRAEVLPVFRNNPVKFGVSVDLTDEAAVTALFASRKISAVIHLAAEARPAECEKNPEIAHATNVSATHNLLVACQKSSPYFLYVSTDMVFNGDRGGYGERDMPDATGVYGRTKTKAELLLQMYSGPWCIVRPSLIYGAPIGGKISSLTWTLDTIRSDQGSFFADEVRTPVWIKDLVSLLIVLCDARHQGIVHAGGPERLTRLDFANFVAQEWDLSKEQIRSAKMENDPINRWRPRDLSLLPETAHDLHCFTNVAAALHAVRISEKA